MLQADLYHDEILALCGELEGLDLQTRDDVERFVRALTKLTYDHCMFGLLYDYYSYDVEVLRENARRLHGVEEVVVDRQALLAAFPDLKTRVEHVIVAPGQAGGWRVFRRMYLSGTNTGPSWKGPATFRSLGEQNLTLFYIAKEEGTWKVTHEMEMRKLF